MPWVHGDDYMKERKAELKNLLILRHLSDSGTKAKMVSRLRAHDDHHPFKFLNLPWEIRNDIYLLLSSEQFPDVASPEEATCCDSLEYVRDRTSLFRTCHQIMNEGLGLFYKKHCFKFYVGDGACCLAIIQWLVNMGPLNRSHIRQLHVECKTKGIANHRADMDRIHQMLTGQPTGAYVPHEVKTMWCIGQNSYFLRRIPIHQIRTKT